MKHEIISRTSNESGWVVQLKKLLSICCRYVVGGASRSSDLIILSFRILQDNMYSSVAIPVRMIEVFTDPKIVTVESVNCTVLEHLSKHGKLTYCALLKQHITLCV